VLLARTLSGGANPDVASHATAKPAPTGMMQRNGTKMPYGSGKPVVRPPPMPRFARLGVERTGKWVGGEEHV
jgi:hypothetical protein